MSVGTIGGSHGVGDESDSMRSESESKFHHGVLHMESIVDELDDDPRVFDCSRNWSWIAMMKAVHCIEHVGHDSGTGVKSFFRHAVVGVAMSDGRHHASCSETSNGIKTMWQFRCDGDLPQASVCGVQQLFDMVRRGVDEAVRIMGAFSGRRQERAFQMGAQNIGASRHLVVHRS